VDGSCVHGDEPSGSLKLLGISSIAAQLADSQEGPSFVSKAGGTYSNHWALKCYIPETLAVVEFRVRFRLRCLRHAAQTELYNPVLSVELYRNLISHSKG
jgi:hypothetical protein